MPNHVCMVSWTIRLAHWVYYYDSIHHAQGIEFCVCSGVCACVGSGVGCVCVCVYIYIWCVASPARVALVTAPVPLSAQISIILCHNPVSTR